MSSTETLQIFPSSQIPSMQAKSGRHPSEGVPYRWLEALVQEIQAHIPDEQERNSCLVFGTEGLRAEYQHTLSPMEVLSRDAQRQQEILREARGLLPREGSPMSPEVLARLRQLLGA